MINQPEAQAVVDQIRECCEDPIYNGKTMGVISLLGEDQAKLIEKLLLETIGPEEMEKRHLVCGDAYAFQGDERDVTFLTLVSAPMEGHRIHPLASPKDERRFNVAVSRAKDQIWLFHTATLNDLGPNCLRYRLLQYCQNPQVQPITIDGLNIERLRTTGKTIDRANVNPPFPFDSWFEVDVFLKIVERRYRVIPQFEIAGYRIDLVIEGMEGRLAVECDGDAWHGAERFQEDMARQRMLERSGWTILRIRGSEYYRNPEIALERLWAKLKASGIKPFRQYEYEQVVKDMKEVDSGRVREATRAMTGSSELPAVEQSNLEEEGIKGHQQKEKITDEEVLWVSRIGAKIWFQLARWAKVQGHFEPDDRRLLFNIGRKVQFNFKYPPSPIQARRAKKLLEKAQRLGFNPEE